MIFYLHVGRSKTGTTTIQNFLFANKDKLVKYNLVYPLEFLYNHCHWPLVNAISFFCEPIVKDYFYNKNFNRIDKISAKCIEALNVYKCGKYNILLSLENFELLSKEQLIFLRELLTKNNKNEIKIIYYMRDSLSLCNSLFQQGLKYHSFSLSPVVDSKYLQLYSDVFGKENLIVRLFSKEEFYDNDLLKDFLYSIGIKWNDEFVINNVSCNQSLDLIGIELLSRINKILPVYSNGRINYLREGIVGYFQKHFILKDKQLKYSLDIKNQQFWFEKFSISNEWVRKEFFPHKERLFPKKDLTNYKENYELKEMKPEYWDRIAEFIADIVKTKNQAIVDKTTIIQNKDKLIAQKDQIIQTKNQELTQTKNQLDSTKQQLESKTKELSFLPIKKQTLEIKNLEQDNLLKQIQIQEAKQDLINKQLHTKKLEKELEYETNVLKELEIKNQQLTQTKNQLDFAKKQLESANKILSSNPNPSHFIQNTSNFKGKLAYLNTLTTAKDRIHNHLSYKLGQAMIENSKSLLGYIRMPFVLSYIKDKHKQEQQQYQEAIKKNPNLKLPNLESYPDYKESLKEKECLTYKLGEAFMKADKTWYKGGYVKLWFEVRKLKKEFEK